jgi:hypothetical protein
VKEIEGHTDSVLVFSECVAVAIRRLRSPRIGPTFGQGPKRVIEIFQQLSVGLLVTDEERWTYGAAEKAIQCSVPRPDRTLAASLRTNTTH